MLRQPFSAYSNLFCFKESDVPNAESDSGFRFYLRFGKATGDIAIGHIFTAQDGDAAAALTLGSDNSLLGDRDNVRLVRGKDDPIGSIRGKDGGVQLYTLSLLCQAQLSDINGK